MIACAKDKNGKNNPITLGWSMTTSGKPPMTAISIGLTRYTLDVIRHAESFVISFPSSAMAEETLYFGTRSGRDTDKIAEIKCRVKPAEEIDTVIFEDAVANFECVLESELKTGDHVIFVGRIVAAHMNRDETIERLYSLSTGHVMGAIHS